MPIAPAINGTEQRLDAIIQQNVEIIAGLRSLGVTPEAPAGLVELREPAAPEEPAPVAQSPAGSGGTKPSPKTKARK